MMKKLGVRTVADLMRLVDQAGIVGNGPRASAD
jgi:hypothetical protein